MRSEASAERGLGPKSSAQFDSSRRRVFGGVFSRKSCALARTAPTALARTFPAARARTPPTVTALWFVGPPPKSLRAASLMGLLESQGTGAGSAQERPTGNNLARHVTLNCSFEKVLKVGHFFSQFCNLKKGGQIFFFISGRYRTVGKYGTPADGSSSDGVDPNLAQIVDLKGSVRSSSSTVFPLLSLSFDTINKGMTLSFDTTNKHCGRFMTALNAHLAFSTSKTITGNIDSSDEFERATDPNPERAKDAREKFFDSEEFLQSEDLQTMTIADRYSCLEAEAVGTSRERTCWTH